MIPRRSTEIDTSRFTPAAEGIGDYPLNNTGDPIGSYLASTLFDSPEALERSIRERLYRDGTWHHMNDLGTAGHSWSWGFWLPQALALLDNGWASGVATVKGFESLANNFIAATETESMQYDTSGAMVDVASFLSGVPECMLTFDRAQHIDRRVTLVLDMFVSCGNNADLIFERGRIVLGALLALQAAGVAVRLIGRIRTYGKRGKVDTEVILHEAGAIIDPSRLLVRIAHPAWTRAVLFQQCYIQGCGNGIPCDTAPVKAGEIRIPGLQAYDHNWMNPANNEAFVRSLFAAAEKGAAA